MKYDPITKARAGYYDDPEDTDKVLWGAAMSRFPALQLTGDWRADYRSFLHNCVPQSGAKLRRRDQEVTGMSFALTLPKCVSVLELLDIDPRVGKAVEQAVKTCLSFVELITAPAGQLPDGKSPCAVVCAGFLQRLVKGKKRVPHRHCHLDVLSVAWAPGKMCVTAANLELLSHAGSLLQTLFQHQTAWELAQLGYTIRGHEHSFTIEGFPWTVVTQFNAGPRPRQRKPVLRLADGFFAGQQACWLADLGPEGVASLKKLAGEPPVPAGFETRSKMEVLAARLTEQWCFMPVDEIAVGMLQNHMGKGPVDLQVLSRWIAGESLDHAGVRAFPLAGRWCWGKAKNLKVEERLIEMIRDLPLAAGSWLPAAPEEEVAWWRRQLAEDCHRVAILRVDLDHDELVQLEKDLGKSTVEVMKGVRTLSRAPMAEMSMNHLRDGGRLLVVVSPKAKSDQIWTKVLARYVPVLHASKTRRLLVDSGLDARFRKGLALEVFAKRFSHRPGWHLLVPQAKVATSTEEIRTLRAKARTETKTKRVAEAEAAPATPPKIITRNILRPTSEAPRPGLRAQLVHNAGVIRASETLHILAVEAEGLLVERPNGLRARVPRGLCGDLDLFTLTTVTVAPGDRIRLVRNNGPQPQKTGLRRGRGFVVRAVESDGTVRLSGGRSLPPAAGHWEHDYCRAIEGMVPPRKCQVVCDADDLTALARHGWLNQKVTLVICAATPEAAEQALAAAVAERPQRELPGTEEIGLAIAADLELVPAKAVGEKTPKAKVNQPAAPELPPPDDSGPPTGVMEVEV